MAAIPRFRCWIFDMDGTLTVPVHDFAAMRAEIGLPEGVGTLEGLAALPESERAASRALLDEIGWRYVERARPQPRAAELMHELRSGGAALGVVTRNSRKNTLGTLDRIGLAEFFPPETVLSRDDLAPKPAPDPVYALMEQWSARAEETVIVGDAIYDLQAGRAAGISTVFLDPDGDGDARGMADHRIGALEEILGHLELSR